MCHKCMAKKNKTKETISDSWEQKMAPTYMKALYIGPESINDNAKLFAYKLNSVKIQHQ